MRTGQEQVGGFGASFIPLLLMLCYLYRTRITAQILSLNLVHVDDCSHVCCVCVFCLSLCVWCVVWCGSLCLPILHIKRVTATQQTFAFCSYRCMICAEKHCQTVEFLEQHGAMTSQWQQKSHVEANDKSLFHCHFMRKTNVFTWNKKRNASLILVCHCVVVVCVRVSVQGGGVVWCGVVWCGVVWCGVVWCGVVWCGVVWCGVVWCGVVWCGVVWCGVVWCGVVWCGGGGGVVWCCVVLCCSVGLVLGACTCVCVARVRRVRCVCVCVCVCSFWTKVKACLILIDRKRGKLA